MDWLTHNVTQPAAQKPTTGARGAESRVIRTGVKGVVVGELFDPKGGASLATDDIA